MKANIPREQEIAIYDYIYLSVMVEVLEVKAAKGMELDKQIKTVLKELGKIKAFLRDNQIKVHPVIVLDDMFVQYNVTCKVEGGYREGDFRFWKSALTYTLNKKMKLLQKGECFIETDFG